MRRALAVAAVVAAAAGACHDGRTGVLVTLQAPGLDVDELVVAVTLDGDALPRSATKPIAAAAKPIDGKRLEADVDVLQPTGATVEVTALLGGAVVGHGTASGVVLAPHQLVAARVRLSGAEPPDLGNGADLAGSDGAVGPADLAAGVVAVTHLPSPVPAGSAAVTLSQSIDTTSFLVDGNSAPGGASFGDIAGFAVLSVGSLTVVNRVVVSGSRALIVVAADRVNIEGVLDAGAVGVNGGPGARGGGTGAGGTGDYLGNSGSSAGGGGGGFGSAGGVGGSNTNVTTGMAGAAGITVGDATLTTLAGGTRGGNAGCADNTGARYVVGGGGGGALQLTAVNAVGVAAAGQILAGGGGGVSFVTSVCVQNGGGGGGSGGAIFVEAATISIAGVVRAAGGSGAAGADHAATATNGSNGGAACPTPGGASGNEAIGGSGACSGNGGNGANPTGDFVGGGGGGGGAGRIVLRSHAAPTFTPSSVQPTPALVSF